MFPPKEISVDGALHVPAWYVCASDIIRMVTLCQVFAEENTLKPSNPRYRRCHHSPSLPLHPLGPTGNALTGLLRAMCSDIQCHVEWPTPRH